MKAEARSRISIMSTKINLNFDKPTMSKGILELLSKGLVDDPDRDVLKISLKEGLATLAKGYKLAYGPANDLLSGILKALSLEDSDIEDEIDTATSSQGDEPLFTPTQDTSSGSGSDTETGDLKDPNSKKEPLAQKPVCKFFTNGKCKFNKECRFQHPKICQKFRHHGDSKYDANGCDGKCDEFHPNACRNSLKSKTCTYKECRFYHIKGTKTIERGNVTSQGSQHKKGNSKASGKGNQLKQNKSNTVPTKNRFSVLDQKQSNAKLVSQQVFQKERTKLDSTLDIIMQELADIRNWQKVRTEQPQHYGSQPMFRPQTPGTGLTIPIPVVPQPGTPWSTQDQHVAWNSPNY